MTIQPARILIAAIIASILIYFWGFVFWALIPVPEFAHRKLDAEQISALDDAFKNLDRGTYVQPQPDEDESAEDFAERHEKEFVYSLNFYPKGQTMMPPIVHLQAFVHGLAASVIIGVLLSMTAGSFCCYSHRVFFVVMIGLFATIWVDVGDSIWWFRTCGTTFWHSIYHIIAWTLAGLVMAAIIKAPTRAADAKQEKG